jgi:hypothetical protein
VTKDELKAKAKEAGLKVRDSFMDDLPENLLWLAVGAFGGYLLAKFL